MLDAKKSWHRCIITHQPNLFYMIEVFATNVQEATEASWLLALLARQFPGNKINFDLSDCDKILRVEGRNFTADSIILLLKETGYACAVLE
jgi:hypothetical protein